MDPEVIEALKKRYHMIPILVHHRSKEKAKTLGELFDILDTCPEEYPYSWSSSERRWIKTDLLQLNSIEKERKP